MNSPALARLKPLKVIEADWGADLSFSAFQSVYLMLQRELDRYVSLLECFLIVHPSNVETIVRLVPPLLMGHVIFDPELKPDDWIFYSNGLAITVTGA